MKMKFSVVARLSVALGTAVAIGFTASQAYGLKHGHTRHTTEEVLEIRRLYSTGNYSQREIAEMFGLSSGGVRSIVTRKSRKYE